MDSFVVIPEHPDYSISSRGEVRSKHGNILSVNSRGQVSLRVDNKSRLFFLGDLLAMSGVLSSGEYPEKAELENRLRWARKVNGHLLALIEDLRKARPARPAPGKSRAARMEEKFLEPLDFETMDGWEG